MSYSFEFCALPDTAALRTEWQHLENKGTGSFFISWHWISTWIEFAERKAHLYLVKILWKQQLVAAAIIATPRIASDVGRDGLAILHGTGDDSLDAIYVEMNGLQTNGILDGEPVHVFMRAMLSRECPFRWKTLRLPGLAEGDQYIHAAVESRLVVSEQSLPAPSVNLDALRRRGQGYVDALTKKARYAIRHARSSYEFHFGPMSVDRAASSDEAIQMLGRLAEFHQKRWNMRGEPGAFANSQFVAFHQNLIRRAYPDRHVDLLCVRAGNRPLGYAYVFVYRGVASFYQSGYDYHILDGNNEPGYACLSEIIPYYQNIGIDIFDFLAGDSLYKRRLSTDLRSVKWITVERRSPAALTRQLARQLRVTLRRLAT